jgi:HPt (histidine-containing phosphotransfer) domain-containing protein
MGWTSARAAPAVAGHATVEAAIDRSYLARFTLGNAALEQEVLELFATQAPLYLARLRGAATQAEWREAVHTIKGSAAAIGAKQLQHFAELAERVDPGLGRAAGQAKRDLAVALICEATIAVCRQIDALFGRGGGRSPSRHA